MNYDASLWLTFLLIGLATLLPRASFIVLGQRDTPGYASIMAVMLFSNGIILIGLGVIGEYLSRVFIETKGRPLFIIRDIYQGEREER